MNEGSGRKDWGELEDSERRGAALNALNNEFEVILMISSSVVLRSSLRCRHPSHKFI